MLVAPFVFRATADHQLPQEDRVPWRLYITWLILLVHWNIIEKLQEVLV